MYIKANRHLEKQLKDKDYTTIELWLEHRNYENEPAFRDNEEEAQSAFVKAIDMKRWREALLLFQYRHTYPHMVLIAPPTPKQFRSALKNLHQEAFPSRKFDFPSKEDKHEFWKKEQQEHADNYHMAGLKVEVAMMRHYLDSIPAHEVKKNETQIAEQFIPALIQTIGKDQALLFVLNHQPAGMKLHRLLLDQGANPNAYAVHPISGRIKHQALKVATHRGQPLVVKDLLKAGANPHWRFEQGDFFLSNACEVVPQFDLKSKKLGEHIQTYYDRRLTLIDSFKGTFDDLVIDRAYLATALSLSASLPEFKGIPDLIYDERLFVLGDYFEAKFKALTSMKALIPSTDAEQIHSALVAHFQTHLEKGLNKNSDELDIRARPDYNAIQGLFYRYSVKASTPAPRPTPVFTPRF